MTIGREIVLPEGSFRVKDEEEEEEKKIRGENDEERGTPPAKPSDERTAEDIELERLRQENERLRSAPRRPTPTKKKDLLRRVGGATTTEVLKTRRGGRDGVGTVKPERDIEEPSDPFFGGTKELEESEISVFGPPGGLLQGLFGEPHGETLVTVTTLERPVAVPGGLSILALLKDVDNNQGFRVKFRDETLDWFPER
ncbi:hypothetical protein LCGC14_1827760 [marine sediment metagenome]|uniref:Uncharacterized protein n=1 Tax=marine sediment metagenome TaxID=412755 RepID=A0A0F9IWJ7_9ZZZZ